METGCIYPRAKRRSTMRNEGRVAASYHDEGWPGRAYVGINCSGNSAFGGEGSD